MSSIKRFSIPTTDEPFEVKIKGFQEVVHAGFDEQGDWCFWVVANPDMPEEAWTFRLVQDEQVFDSAKWVHMRSFDSDLTTGKALHLLRPLHQWGVQSGASMDNDEPVVPSASTTRHMIGDLRKHLRSAGILLDALAMPFGGGVGSALKRLDDVGSYITQLLKESGIPEDSVTLGYEDESH